MGLTQEQLKNELNEALVKIKKMEVLNSLNNIAKFLRVHIHESEKGEIYIMDIPREIATKINIGDNRIVLRTQFDNLPHPLSDNWKSRLGWLVNILNAINGTDGTFLPDTTYSIVEGIPILHTSLITFGESNLDREKLSVIACSHVVNTRAFWGLLDYPEVLDHKEPSGTLGSFLLSQVAEYKKTTGE